MLDEFKQFIMRGNVLDLAVGFIMGAAFSGIVKSLVSDIIMPPIGYIMGDMDFSQIYINLSGGDYDSLAAAQEAGAATINIGLFLNTLINFLIVAFVIFIIIRAANKAGELGGEEEAEEEPTTKDCPYCKSSIAIDATRCPNCTSQLETA